MAASLVRRAAFSARCASIALRPAAITPVACGVATALSESHAWSPISASRAISTSRAASDAAEPAAADGRQANNPTVLDRKPEEGEDNSAEGIRAALNTLDPNVQVVSADGSRTYSADVVALGDKVLQLNLLDVQDLMDYLQEKLGIDDAALVMPIGGGGGGGGGAAAVEEEAPAEVAKTHFEIKLEKFDAKAKIKIIKEVRGLTGLGLKEAKELVESAPATIMKDVKASEAEEIAAKLKELGAEIALE